MVEKAEDKMKDSFKEVLTREQSLKEAIEDINK